jgi:hypothetical protein
MSTIESQFPRNNQRVLRGNTKANQKTKQKKTKQKNINNNTTTKQDNHMKEFAISTVLSR